MPTPTTGRMRGAWLVLLPDAEWAKLAAGILQRARLIDAVLADLHGTQRLLQDGSLPASLLLGSPAFVRTSVDREAPDRRFLYAYACDVAHRLRRVGDPGRPDRYRDRQRLCPGQPGGAQPRLAQLFRDCRTRRLAGHFLRLQESFQGLCRRDDGRIVILSPGPASPSYFSHAYLARYLGYTVVESGDLTVRDNQVYLKTLDGLQRVYLDRGQAARPPDGPAAPAGQRARRHPGAGPGREERHRRDGQSAWQRRGAESRPGPVRRRTCSGACSARHRFWPTCPHAGWARPTLPPRPCGSPSAGR